MPKMLLNLKVAATRGLKPGSSMRVEYRSGMVFEATSKMGRLVHVIPESSDALADKIGVKGAPPVAARPAV